VALFGEPLADALALGRALRGAGGEGGAGFGRSGAAFGGAGFGGAWDGCGGGGEGARRHCGGDRSKGNGAA
jgi:hypothetical protein